LPRYTRPKPHARHPLGERWIKASKGVFEMDEMTATEMRAVILDRSYENTYFPTPYNALKKTDPTCFALNADQRLLAPGDGVPKPESEGCTRCWPSRRCTC
jgi:hypothetical protein